MASPLAAASAIGDSVARNAIPASAGSRAPSAAGAKKRNQLHLLSRSDGRGPKKRQERIDTPKARMVKNGKFQPWSMWSRRLPKTGKRHRCGGWGLREPRDAGPTRENHEDGRLICRKTGGQVRGSNSPKGSYDRKHEVSICPADEAIYTLVIVSAPVWCLLGGAGPVRVAISLLQAVTANPGKTLGLSCLKIMAILRVVNGRDALHGRHVCTPRRLRSPPASQRFAGTLASSTPFLTSLQRGERDGTRRGARGLKALRSVISAALVRGLLLTFAGVCTMT